MEMLEGYTESIGQALEASFIGLPALPPPMPKARGVPINSVTQAQREFFEACADGRLFEVRLYVANTPASSEEIQDGLASAASGNQLATVSYLLEQDTSLHAEAVMAACRNRSVAMLNIFLRFGWQPNQQLPVDQSYPGGSTALMYVAPGCYSVPFPIS